MSRIGDLQAKINETAGARHRESGGDLRQLLVDVCAELAPGRSIAIRETPDGPMVILIKGFEED